MCSIYISKYLDDFISLRDFCDFRGNFSYSVMTVKDNLFTLNKSFNKINNIVESDFYIGHSQAPTSGMIKDENRIHPCNDNNSYLYHNGIIKKSFLEKYSSEKWDTKVLFNLLQDFGFDILSEIDGSFACVYIRDSNIYIFRNKLCTLYYNENNICSVKYNNTYNIVPDGKVFIFNNFLLEETGISFTTKNNPYELK